MKNNLMQYAMIACLVLALISALAYILMINRVIEPGNLVEEEEGPLSPALYFIPAGYIIGGILIFLKKRWLWMTGAFVNLFGIIVFYVTYINQPDVMWSAPGLITKIAQILLEAGLIYLIVTFTREKFQAET